jgi:hypothetical protein
MEHAAQRSAFSRRPPDAGRSGAGTTRDRVLIRKIGPVGRSAGTRCWAAPAGVLRPTPLVAVRWHRTGSWRTRGTEPDRGGHAAPNRIVADTRHRTGSWRIRGTEPDRGGHVAPNRIVADACARTAAEQHLPPFTAVWHLSVAATQRLAPNWRGPTLRFSCGAQRRLLQPVVRPLVYFCPADR